MARFTRRATMDETCPNSISAKKVSNTNNTQRGFNLLGFARKLEESSLVIDTMIFINQEAIKAYPGYKNKNDHLVSLKNCTHYFLLF